MANELSSIKYIVQLMLENRSFDQVLGFLYESSGNKSPTGQDFARFTAESYGALSGLSARGGVLLDPYRSFVVGRTAL